MLTNNMKCAIIAQAIQEKLLGGEGMYNRTNYMPEFMARKQICDIESMYNRGYVAANDGNISVRIGRDTTIQVSHRMYQKVL